MVNKIIFLADIHIRNLRRMDEYKIQLKKFIEECKSIVAENGADNTRIAIVGDIFQSNITISPEANIMASWFLRQLDDICKTVVISGNHDMLMNNTERVDAITPIFAMSKFKQTFYLDKQLDYESGCIIDDNIVWCVYSSFDGFNRPNIEEVKTENPDKHFVGLIHTDIKGSKTDVGYVLENGIEASYFDNLNVCLCGHIHKRQRLDYNGIPIIYPGSLIQQEHGENLSKHGFLVWNVDEENYEEYNIDNPNYGFYTFGLNSIEDLDNDNEKLINL